MKDNINILFIIATLEAGGAQRTLYQLVRGLKEKNPDTVISLINLKSNKDSLSEEFEELTDDLFHFDLPKLSLRKFKEILYFFIKIRSYPNLQLIGWMYHGSLLAWLLSLLKPSSSVYFSIHHSGVDRTNLSIRTLFIVYLLKLISYLNINKIIYCGNNCRDVHNQFGFSEKKAKVIFNGVDHFSNIDFKKYSVTTNDNLSFRMIMAARYAEIKNHDAAFAALNHLKRKGYKNIKLDLCGEGTGSNNIDLLEKLKQYQIEEEVTLIGVDKSFRVNIKNYDVLLLPSKSEAFPLVIPEAMLMGVPCIASSVGDIPLVIGSNGWLIDPNKENDLEAAIVEALKMRSFDINSWETLKKTCTESIKNNFGIEKTVNEYYSCLEKD